MGIPRMTNFTITFWLMIAVLFFIKNFKNLGASFAGTAGVLFSHYFFIAHPASFTFMRSFDILTMVVLGGLGSLTGSITGAILLTFISAALADFPEWRMIIYSLAMIILMLYRPQGLFGNKELSEKVFNSLKGGKSNE